MAGFWFCDFYFQICLWLLLLLGGTITSCRFVPLMKGGQLGSVISQEMFDLLEVMVDARIAQTCFL